MRRVDCQPRVVTASPLPTEIPTLGCSEEGSFRKLFSANSSTVCMERGPALPPDKLRGGLLGNLQTQRQEVSTQRGLKWKLSHSKWFLAGSYVLGQYFFP